MKLKASSRSSFSKFHLVNHYQQAKKRMKGTSQSFILRAKRDFTSITPTVTNQALNKGTHSIAFTQKNVFNTRLDYNLVNTICTSAVISFDGSDKSDASYIINMLYDNLFTGSEILTSSWN